MSSLPRLTGFLELAILKTDASEDVVTPANVKMVASFPKDMYCTIHGSCLLFQVVFRTGVQRFPHPNKILLYIFPSMWFLPASPNNVHAALKVF